LSRLKNTAQKIVRSAWAFLIPYAIYLIFGIAVLLQYSKAQIHISINTYDSEFFDYFFKYITNLGDGSVPFILALIFIFYSYRKAFVVATAGTLAGLLAQLLKHTFFNGYPRPVKFFEGSYNLHLVEGVHMHSSFSFPSGHSATIFAVCFFFVLYSSRNSVKIILFCLAVIVAFSRVYLSQHFLTDTLAGSFLGVISAFFMYYLFERINNSWIDRHLMLRKTKA